MPQQAETQYRVKHGMIGLSDSMLRVYDAIDVVAMSKSNVLITGRTGTGKELVADAIHKASGRSGRYVPVNCAGIPLELLESELFGHAKGAFTGAYAPKKGKFLHADLGTIFLDEVGEMHPSLQAKLLRVLQYKSFTPVGVVEEIKVDVRIIAATNRNLEQEVGRGRFREDLYYRLNVFPISLPDLRERREDIHELAQYFTDVYCRENQIQRIIVSDEAAKILQQCQWPGNVRQLESLIERAMISKKSQPGILAEADVAKLLDTQTYIPMRLEDFDRLYGGKTWDEVEMEFIAHALRKSDFNRRKTAQLINMGERTLRNRLKLYRMHGIDITGETQTQPNGNGASFGIGTLAEIERHHILRIMERYKGNRAEAAEILGIDPKTLYNKLKEYDHP